MARRRRQGELGSCPPHRPPPWICKLALFVVSSQPLRRRVAVIGASLDLGAGRRGVDMGPSAIRYAGLASRLDELGYDYADLGNVETAVPEATESGDEHARFLPQIKDTSQRIAQLVAHTGRDGFVPVGLGGDHPGAQGTLAGIGGAGGRGGALGGGEPGELT